MKTIQEIFMEARRKGGCDGFFWPYEGGRLSRFEWEGGDKVVSYETKAGTLFLGEGDFRSYGFVDEADFAKAAKKGELTAKSTKGLLTIGHLRKFPETDRAVYFITPMERVKLEFPVTGPEEEADVRLFLSELGISQKDVFSASKFLGGFRFPTGSFIQTWRGAMGSGHKKKIFKLGIVGLMAVACVGGGLFSHYMYIAAGILGLLFVSMVGITGRNIEEAAGMGAPGERRGQAETGE